MKALVLVLLLALPAFAQDYLSQVEHQARMLRQIDSSIGEHMRAMVDDLNNLSPDVPAYREWSAELAQKTEALVQGVEAMQPPADARELQEALQDATERAQRCSVHVKATIREVEELAFQLRRDQGMRNQGQLVQVMQSVDWLKTRKKAFDSSLTTLRQRLEEYEAAHPAPSP